MSVIAIDPGHGGKDPGAIGPTGLKEKDCALKIALKLGQLLQKHKVSVIYTRTNDSYPSLTQRVAIANKAKADYFVSIHLNSSTNPAAKGTETFSFQRGTVGEKLAQRIQSHLVKSIGTADRGVKQESFLVLRETKMPAVLVEVCFISNPKEEALLKSETFLNKAAEGISKGILAQLNTTQAATKIWRIIQPWKR